MNFAEFDYFGLILLTDALSGGPTYVTKVTLFCKSTYRNRMYRMRLVPNWAQPVADEFIGCRTQTDPRGTDEATCVSLEAAVNWPRNSHALNTLLLDSAHWTASLHSERSKNLSDASICSSVGQLVRSTIKRRPCECFKAEHQICTLLPLPVICNQNSWKLSQFT